MIKEDLVIRVRIDHDERPTITLEDERAAMDEYSKQEAIEFAKFKNHYENHAPIGEFPDDEQLYDLFKQSKTK